MAARMTTRLFKPMIERFFWHQSSKPKSITWPLILLTEADGRLTYWSLNADGSLNVCPEPASNAANLCISFSDQDVAFAVARDTAHQKAVKLLAREFGERMHVINCAKSLGLAFGTAQARIESTAQRLISGSQLLADLLKNANDLDHKTPIMTGFLLGHEPEQLLLLFVRDANGIGKIQAIPKVADVPFAIKSFASTRHIEFQSRDDQTNVVLFEFKDFLAALPTARPYPRDGEWLGITHAHWWNGAAAASFATLIAMSAWAGWNYVQLKSAQSLLTEKNKIIQVAQQQIRRLATEHYNDFIRLEQVNLTQPILLARRVYEPGGHVVLNATTQQIKLESEVDVKSAMATETPFTLPTRLARLPPDSHCAIESIASSSNVQQFKVTYVCPQSATRISSLFDVDV